MRQIFAISDLHIGGAEHPMLGHPEVLIDFLDRWTALADANTELVIHGDFVDFLAEQPYEAWTPDEPGTLTKLRAIFARSKPLFDAFARCAGAPGRLTILLGNHDVELAYPKVRDALFERLGTGPHGCYFLHGDDGYRVGDVFIEHGNRYDPWNRIDHDGLHRALAAVARGQAPAKGDPKACPGSCLVEKAMNPLKETYHFVDLLKPEDQIVLLLLYAFEPARFTDVKMVYHVFKSYLKQLFRGPVRGEVTRGEQPVSARGDELSPEIRAAFAAELQELQELGVSREVTRGPLIKSSSESLANVLRESRTVDPQRARKLQLALATKVAGDLSFATRDGSGAYAAAARAMTARPGTRLVIMGHTHLARDVSFDNGGHYINTGTWADLIRADQDALTDRSPDHGVFLAWLRKLATNDLAGLRVCQPGYAKVTVDDDGHIIGQPRLGIHQTGAKI